MSDWDLDLLGDPIPDGLGKRGRPAHVPTLENRRKIIVLLGIEKRDEEIAAALGITPPTLRKYYFRELSARTEARHRVEGKVMMALLDAAVAGNAAAADKILKRFDRIDLIRGTVKHAAAPKLPKLGKKEQRLVEARSSGREGSWGDLVGGNKAH